MLNYSVVWYHIGTSAFVCRQSNNTRPPPHLTPTPAERRPSPTDLITRDCAARAWSVCWRNGVYSDAVLQWKIIWRDSRKWRFRFDSIFS